ncbi:hypothetical protein EV356DRAFT_509286 [Viridothelium virens]|uniref:Uncharacterized protein n=1 Tax=Viridothelium virens TaxID=1048519 RepID=A0A6A6GXM5_VIRVR|nr:hypothetical protein EV356DRAFT_509286 [Viridothelium virens]
MAASPSHGVTTRPPNGECSYRDLGLGTAAPTCGCHRFWGDESRRKLILGGAVQAGDDIRQTPWCICGHHACFHKDLKRSAIEAFGIEKTDKTSSGRVQTTSQDSDAIFVQYVRPTPDGRIQLVTGSPTTPIKRSKPATPEFLRRNAPTTSQDQPFHPANPPQSAESSQPAQQSKNTTTTQVLSNNPQIRPFPSPRLPAIQRLDGSRPSSAGSQYLRITSSQDRRRDFSGTGQQYDNAGLGLTFTLPGIAPSLPSTTNSIQNGDLPDWARLLKEFNEKPLSNAPSTTSEMQRISPNTAFLQRTSQQGSQARGTLLPPVATSYNFADARIAEEQSATEMATPSNRGTPDLRGFDNILHEVRETVERQTGAAAAGASGHQNSPSADPAVSSLQRLLPHLSAIRDYMASMPQESFQRRLDALENMSTHQASMDDIQGKNDYLEGHLIEIRTKVEEHTDTLGILQGGGSSRRRRLPSAGNEAINASFASNSSIQSTTSSALIAAAIERQETEAKMKDFEERVSQLESTAPPSYAHPLEIEVIFLPWSKDLKGVWFSPDNTPVQSSTLTTQESEEWTHAVNSSQRRSSLHHSGHSGWSSDDIHDWADSTDEWLCPRACGPKGVIYERLRSRGFVKNVELRKSDAGEFQSALRNAFLGLAQHFPSIAADESSQPLGDSTPSISFLGLRKPFVPLRKVHKSSRLRFLSTSEMLTPAIWTAEFLTSSVVMRAQGGQKRLFITNPDAYLQHNDHDGSCWTWQKLRELPRITPIQAESEGGVGEADAKEACWEYHPMYDPPQSLTSSFSSLISSHLSRASVRGTPPPTSQRLSEASSKEKGQDEAQKQSTLVKVNMSSQDRRRLPPVTPLSDSPRHRRTASAPISDYSSGLHGVSSTIEKRRMISFDSAPHPRNALQLSRRTSALSNQSGSSSKRRRISRSPDVERSAIAAAQGFTPRRSKEPPSPFYPPSSQGLPLPRSQGHAGAGDLTAAGPSTGRSWDANAAYATPFSGGHLLPGVVGSAKGGDTEADSAMIDQDEVWEGVTEPDPGQQTLTTNTDIPGHVDTIEISSVHQNTGDFDFDDDSDIEEDDDDDEDQDQD